MKVFLYDACRLSGYNQKESGFSKESGQERDKRGPGEREMDDWGRSHERSGERANLAGLLD